VRQSRCTDREVRVGMAKKKKAAKKKKK